MKKIISSEKEQQIKYIIKILSQSQITTSFDFDIDTGDIYLDHENDKHRRVYLYNVYSERIDFPIHSNAAIGNKNPLINKSKILKHLEAGNKTMSFDKFFDIVKEHATIRYKNYNIRHLFADFHYYASPFSNENCYIVTMNGNVIELNHEICGDVKYFPEEMLNVLRNHRDVAQELFLNEENFQKLKRILKTKED